MFKPSTTTDSNTQHINQHNIVYHHSNNHSNNHSLFFSDSNRENTNNNLCSTLFTSNKPMHNRHVHHHDTYFTTSSHQLLDLEDLMEDEYQALRPCLRTQSSNLTLHLPPKKQYLVKTRQKRKMVIPSSSDATRIII